MFTAAGFHHQPSQHQHLSGSHARQKGASLACMCSKADHAGKLLQPNAVNVLQWQQAGMLTFFGPTYATDALMLNIHHCASQYRLQSLHTAQSGVAVCPATLDSMGL